MAKGKKRIIFLLLLCAVCVVSWTILILNNTANAIVGADIVIEDDFTKTSFIDGESQLKNFNVYEYNGVSCAKNFAEEGFGLIPCVNFMHSFYRPNDGYITYKIQSDDDYYLKTASLDLTSYVSHCSHSAYIGENITNVKVYVATETMPFTQVFSHIPKEDYLGLNANSEARIANAKNNIIDLSEYVAGASVAYVKIELLHPSYEDLSSWISESDSNRSYFVDDEHQWVKRLGVSVLKVKITASQSADGVVCAKVGFTDNYTTTKISESANVQSYDNLLSYPDLHGALPIAVWGAYCDTGDAYAVYKITAKDGNVLKNVNATLNLSLNSSGGLYNWWSGNNDNANVYLDVSTDGGNTWSTELDVLNEPTLQVTYTIDGVPTTMNPFKASYYDEDGNVVSDTLNSRHETSAQVNLAAYSGQEIYLRVRIKHPVPESVHSSFATDGVPMGRVAVYYYGITVTADQETVSVPVQEEDTTGTFTVEDDMRLLCQGFAAWKQERQARGVVTNVYGSNAYGLIPATTWGETVDTENGYMIYTFLLNGNGKTTNLKSLEMNLSSLFNGKVYDGKIVVEYSYDGLIYYVKQTYSTVSGQESENSESMCFDDEIISEQAKSSEKLYVKIKLEHTEAQGVALNDVAVKLLCVKFNGEYNFVMENGASIKFSENGNGLKFTSLINKDFYNSLTESGYCLTFGMVIMPVEYASTYGDINYETVFGKNSVYCWETAAEGKIRILNGVAKLDLDYNDNYHSYNYSVLNILQENLDKKFVAKGYVLCKKGEDEFFIFSDYAEGDIKNNERSVTSVAQNYLGTTEEIKILKSEYLEKVKGQDAIYTVKRVYIDGNEIANVTTETKIATAGTVIAADITAQEDYSFVDGVNITLDENGDTVKKFNSCVTGTVLADGSLGLICYYVKNA